MGHLRKRSEKEVRAPVNILHPEKIGQCARAEVETLCNSFSLDLKDEILLIRMAIKKRETDSIQNAGKFLRDQKNVFPNLTVPVSERSLIN